MNVDGRCLCGGITFEAEIDPKKIFLCHCTDCQTQSGSAFRSATPVPAANFRLTQGTVKLYTKQAESGAKRHLAFCPDCGTSIYGGPADDPDGTLSVRVGTLSQRAALAPVGRVWCRSAPSWFAAVAELPGIETQPPLSKPRP